MTATDCRLLSNLFLWVYWHRAKEDSALDWRVAETFTKKSKPVRDSMASMVVTVGALLEEFVSKR